MNRIFFYIISILVIATSVFFLIILPKRGVQSKPYDTILDRKEQARVATASDFQLFHTMFRDCGYVRFFSDNIQGIRATTITVYVNNKFNDCKLNAEFMKNLNALCLGLNFRKGDKFRVLDATTENEIITYDIKTGLKTHGQ